MSTQPTIAELVSFYGSQTTTHTPSKRHNKNRSGRTNVKRYHSRMELQRVGGYKNLLTAIAQPADAPLCHATPVQVEYFEVPTIEN